MQLTFGLTTLVLLAILAKGHSQLQCYVCDNCAKIDKSTPIEMCGPDVAAATTTMMPSGVPTGTTTETSTSAEPSSTTTTSTTTPSTTTIEYTTPVTGPPTPPTVGPISPTTELPTPPEVELPLDFELPLNNTNAFNSTSNFTLTTPTLTSPTTTTTTTTTTEEPITTFPTRTQSVSLSVFNATTSLPLLRQRRYIPENTVTYHCYKVLKKYDNVYGTQRGCMAVQTQQSVCGELKAANQNQIQKCRPCTKSMCNGSSTIGISIAGLLVALVAVIYRV